MMKQFFTRIILLFLIVLGSNHPMQAQLLLSDNFDYSGTLVSNGWTAHSGAGTLSPTTTAGLTYTGVLGSGVGNAALVNNLGGEDVNRSFSVQNTNAGTVYFSALVNVTDAATAKAGDYFLHIGNGAGASFTTFAARVFARITATGINFGVSNSGTATWGTTNYNRNTTYLIVVKYTINTAGNDPIQMWVVSAGVPVTEAAAGVPEVENVGTTGQDIINSIALRQGSATTSVQVVTDALKVGTSWADVTPSGIVPPSLTVSANSLPNFGSVTVGVNSASQTYNISGSNLQGAPGNITVTAPSADFQVSADNTNWGATASIPFASATLSVTAVYARFRPQTAGIKSGSISHAGGGFTTSLPVAVSGTGLAPITPVLSASTLATFGTVCINSSTTNSFTINGPNLTTAPVAIGPLTGYTFSTIVSGPFTSSLSINQPGGSFTQTVFVRFTPTAIQLYNGNIAVTGAGAPAINVTASGAGSNTAPVVITGGASAITTVSSIVAGNISNNGCTAVSAYGIQYSTSNGFVTGTSVVGSNLNAGLFSVALTGLMPSTTYYYKSFATNAGGTSVGLQQSFITASPTMNATLLNEFGPICINTTSAANSFTLASTGLSALNVNVGPLAGYTFSTTANGTFSNSLSIAQPGGVFSQTVFVKFTPTAMQSYNGNIPVSGGGANNISVSVSGSGANSPASLTTATASNVNRNTAVLSGLLTGTGCSNLSSYGFEYSGIAGFANGSGVKVLASTIDATGAFSVALNGLVQGSTYYFKAFGTNTGGTSYGSEQSFTTSTIADGLVIYNTPVQRGGRLRYSLKNIKPSNYAAKIYNVAGQLVYRKDMIIQVNFIDDSFVVPSNIGTGLYILEIESVDSRTRVQFMIW
jgi:hypothetical protein